MAGREKEAGGGTKRGGGRPTSQRPSRCHSDDEEDEGVPASYHTVSLQVSQDVSTTALVLPLPYVDLSETSRIHLISAGASGLCGSALRQSLLAFVQTSSFICHHNLIFMCSV